MSASDTQLYSTVTIEQAEYTDDDLLPLKRDQKFKLTDSVPPLVDPDGLRNQDTPAFILAVHATDPPIGGGSSDDFSSVIGFRILKKGTYSDSLEVPIFPFTIDGDPLETPRERTPEGQTYPPKPDGDADVVARLWGVTEEPIQDSVEFTRSFGPLNDAGGDGATITSLDQNPSLLPIGEASASEEPGLRRSVLTPETFDDTDAPSFGESVDIGQPLLDEAVTTTVRTRVQIDEDQFLIDSFEEFDSETTIAVGAPEEDHSSNTGSTYVLNGIFEEFEPGEVGLTDEDKPDDGAGFGSAVAYDRDAVLEPPIELLAVGAPLDEEGSGAVYVFTRKGGPWRLKQKLTGSNAGYGSDAGYGVAVDVLVDGDSGQFVLVGAPGADDNDGNPIGDAKLETLTPDGDTSLPVINPPDTLTAGAEFGISVALTDQAPFAFVGASGAGTNGGNAYGFFPEEGETETINLAGKLSELSLSEGDGFGEAVDATFPFAPTVGAPGTDGGRGAVYQFEPAESDTIGFNASRLPADDDVTEDDDFLGVAVSQADPGGPVLAGAPGGRYAALFELTGGESGIEPGSYEFTEKFELPDTPSFGESVAISPDGTRGVVGAPDANGGEGAAFLIDIIGGGIEPT